MKLEKNLLPLVTGKAQAQILNKNFKEALTTFDRALKMSPNNATVVFNRGVIHQKLGYYSEAVADYLRAADIQPKNYQAHFNCSLCLKRLGRLSDALEHINSALAYSPRNVDALYNKANILVKMREYPIALDILKEAASLEPDDASIKEKIKSVTSEFEQWEKDEPSRRKARELKYAGSGRTQLHGYFNRTTTHKASSSSSNQAHSSSSIRVCKLTPEQPAAAATPARAGAGDDAKQSRSRRQQ
eukprot:CAMPEP_0170184876 /NCGR_PEP_ID=MMETSP0040_2-20121228/34896_1 /TAXON_ID=641309 /ORGANISM="Lotharella oceanica, Strain CCMP622" /LENGTH=243 /DNA_ID=CAMNT_0010431073 /DNA_START=255 /DNA_END=989 /DNA_ORIENTATION=+